MQANNSLTFTLIIYFNPNERLLETKPREIRDLEPLAASKNEICTTEQEHSIKAL